jgi:SAM-dependent methyltransferase
MEGNALFFMYGCGIRDCSCADKGAIGCMSDGLVTSATALCAIMAVAVFSASEKAMGKDAGAANVSRHLGVVGRVNLGSFYTPSKYVRIVSEWLLLHGIGTGWTIADLSCGYGAFFELGDVEGLHECRYIGNDIDHEAVEQARVLFPNVQWFEHNALADVSREKFGIGDEEKLVVVGNPPYNDVTSQINQKIKVNTLPIDSDLKTRDLGMSSLLAYNKLAAEYVIVLHPLSYLIKKSNFTATNDFFSNYKLLEHIVFSSQEFAGTSKTASFPVIVAMYKREVGKGLSYKDIVKMWFRTVDGASFSLSGFDYVTDEIDKYPGKKRHSPEILFYTMRDINALRRSRTFIPERIANAIDVDPEKLAYYCYIDCFKRYAEVPYYLGNFNVPFVRAEFASVSNEVMMVSMHNHPEIFGSRERPSAKVVEKVKSYIAKSISGKETQDGN